MVRLRVLVLLAIVFLGAIVACGGSGNSKSGADDGANKAPDIPTFGTVTQPATVTASGLQIIELSVGDGAEAQAGGLAYVTYDAWLADGTFIDTTTLDGTPIPVREILQSGKILEGLVQGIPGMKVGGRRRLIIPPGLGHGAQDFGGIPANSTLIYDIKLVDVR